MTNEWVPNPLQSAAHPEGSPHSVRPETHWLYEEMGHGPGGADRPLWFSLKLSRKKAEELRDDFTKETNEGVFEGLIASGAQMAPASHAALCLALAGKGIPKDAQIGTDILVPRRAFATLKKLTKDYPDVEINDVGLAIADDLAAAAALPREPRKFEQHKLATAEHLPASGTTAATADAASPNDVIIAIIDDGVGIANRRFRETKTTTRIAHFLDLAPGTATNSPQPVDELLARSWTGGEINKLLLKYPDDEEGVYRALGLIGERKGRQPLRAAVSHGTHMLDTAAGYDCGSQDPGIRGKIASRPIIAVQLPTQIPEDRSDAWLPQSLKRALDWILVKAVELSAVRTGTTRRLPLIVDCSFGSMAGPQNGESDVERRITQFVKTYREGNPDQRLCTVVMSAGNTFQLRAAASVSLGPGRRSCELPWRVLPDDKTPSFVEIWLPETDVSGQQVEVSLVPPRDAPEETWSLLDDNKTLDWTINDIVHARLYHQGWKTAEGGSQECVTIAIRPTADDGDPEPVVPAGLWRIKMRAKGGLTKELNIDLRVHRDDAGMYTRGKGRQSYFYDPIYEEFDPELDRSARDERDESDEPSPQARVTAGGGPSARHGGGGGRRRRRRSVVRTQGTLNAYGFGAGTLLVGGYRHSDGAPAAYSAARAENGRGAGPRRTGTRAGTSGDNPELTMIAAVTEESPALQGILATGTYSGSVAILNGTSVAAPLAVRALADEIAAGRSVTDLINTASVFETSNPRGPHGPYQPNRPLRFGMGRLKFEPSKSSYKSRIDD
jgi:hypothetical protein